MRKNFIIFDLNGVLCQSNHISNSASKGPYRSPQDMDYGGRFDTLINKKVVRARPGLRCFLREVLGLAHVIIWSSMLMDNTKAIVGFLFRELAMPCLLLGTVKNTAMTFMTVAARLYPRSEEAAGLNSLRY
jgi:hypothetical protein